MDMKKILILLPLLALLFTLSCSKDDSSDNTPTGKATFSVKLGDAPAGYDAVNVEIIRLEANLGSGWVEFPVETPGVYNLMQFTNGNTLLLIGDTSIAPSTISELRLVLGTNNTVVVDGVTYDLKTPSGQTSGYKVKMDPLPMQPGMLYRLVLDFDVDKSVHPTGNNNYILNPVVRGYLETAVGSIAGTITPAAGAYYVMATNTTDTSGTYINQNTGAFLIPTVMPGTYDVKFLANPGYLDKTIPGIGVIAGQTTQMGTVTIEQ
jgi:hypothetical protein